MSSIVRVGHAEFEIHRNGHDRLVLVAGGYGRDPFAAALFVGDREAAMTRSLLARGVPDIAPIIWESGEEGGARTCPHTYSSVEAGIVVCDSCDTILTRLRPGRS